MVWMCIGNILDSGKDPAYKTERISQFYLKYFLIEKKKGISSSFSYH